MRMFPDLLHPRSELFEGLSLVDWVNQQNCRDSLVKGANYWFVSLLTNLDKFMYYCIPYLQFDVSFLVNLNSFCEVLYPCCDLIIITKDIFYIFHQKGRFSDTLISKYLPELPIRSNLKTTRFYLLLFIEFLKRLLFRLLFCLIKLNYIKISLFRLFVKN